MAVDKNGKWVGIGVGDNDDPATPRDAPNWQAVALLTEHLLGWDKRLDLTVGPSYDIKVAAAVEKFCLHSKINLPVVRDASGQAVANLAMRKRLGSFPPPPPPTHAMFTVRGTGGVVGVDYTSIVAQNCRNHHEHPVDYPATMGGIPVAVAGAGPSGNECAQLVRQQLTDLVLGSTVTFSVCGYSLGTKGVVLFLNDLFTPGHPLFAHRGRVVSVILIADPWRPYGSAFYGAPIPDGEGIGSPGFTLSDAARRELGWRICWLSDPSDMYANAPRGATGTLLFDVEEIILNFSASDPLSTFGVMIQQGMKLLTQDAGLMQMLPTGGLLGGLLGGGSLAGAMTGIATGGQTVSPNLAAMLLPLMLGGFQGLIGGISGNGQNLPSGPAADVQAMILALKFYGSGIAGHVNYHARPWSSHGPQTYLELAIQHGNDYGARVPVIP